MKIRYAHLCDYAIVSQEGKPSICGIFDRLNAQSVPVVHPLMHLVFEIELHRVEAERAFQIHVSLLDADGEKVMELKGDHVPTDQAHSGRQTIVVRQLLAIQGLVFPKFGEYEFVLTLNGSVGATLPLTVEQKATA